MKYLIFVTLMVLMIVGNCLSQDTQYILEISPNGTDWSSISPTLSFAPAPQSITHNYFGIKSTEDRWGFALMESKPEGQWCYFTVDNSPYKVIQVRVTFSIDGHVYPIWSVSEKVYILESSVISTIIHLLYE